MKRVYYSPSYTNVWGRGGPSETNLVYGLHDDCLVVSQNHTRNENGVYSTGGPLFILQRHYEPYFAQRIDWMKNGLPLARTPYIGTTYPVHTSPIPSTSSDYLQPVMADDAVESFGFGATGWSRARPGNPLASFDIMFGELAAHGVGIRRYPRLQTLPRLLYRRLDLFKRLGGRYLDTVFGWLPFVKDVQDMYMTYRKVDRHLAQIRRNNGKGIRRSRIIRDIHTVTTSEGGSDSYPFVGWNNVFPNYVGGKSRVLTTVETIDKVWFEARFRYYIADVSSPEWTQRATRALYGRNVTPDALWELLPWSWMIDWYSNMGDIMSNMSTNAVDNLTADYAYIMRTRISRTKVEAQTSWNTGTGYRTIIPAGSIGGMAVNETIIKSRYAASPYGFGVDFGDLTPYRASIIAAIGASRW